MKFFIQAKPNAREEKVERVNDTHFLVSVKELPVKGMANQAIITALAGYFHIPAQNVKIVSGHISRRKIVEVLGVVNKNK